MNNNNISKFQVLSAKVQLVHYGVKSKKMSLLESLKSKFDQLSKTQAQDKK